MATLPPPQKKSPQNRIKYAHGTMNNVKTLKAYLLINHPAINFL